MPSLRLVMMVESKHASTACDADMRDSLNVPGLDLCFRSAGAKPIVIKRQTTRGNASPAASETIGIARFSLPAHAPSPEPRAPYPRIQVSPRLVGWRSTLYIPPMGTSYRRLSYILKKGLLIHFECSHHVQR